MTVFERTFPTTRRKVLKLLALLGLGGSEFARAAAALAEPSGRARESWPKMTYRTLGRTDFRGSRLVFGCGAALMFWGKDELLDEAFDHGVNVFDVGTSRYYRNAESNLADFAKKHRDRIFLISKGLVGIEIEPGDALSRAQCKAAANNCDITDFEATEKLVAQAIEEFGKLDIVKFAANVAAGGIGGLNAALKLFRILEYGIDMIERLGPYLITFLWLRGGLERKQQPV